MPQIRPNDPRRRHLHDFVVLDHDLKQRAAFGSYAEAAAWVTKQKPGAWVISIVHPENCGCNPLDPPAAGRNN